MARQGLRSRHGPRGVHDLRRRKPDIASLAYFDALRAERLPAALIQGLRDNFGAHTYQRVDREGSFHTTWAADRTESPA